MQVLWTYAARQDLVDIGDYIALRSPDAAARFVAELLDRTEILRTSPLVGRMVPELGREDIRELIHGNYRIIYRRGSGAIQILTVFEGHRLFDADGLNQLGPEKRYERDYAIIGAAAARIAALPGLSDAPADEILGYDHNGLPS